jgi:aminotransferase
MNGESTLARTATRFQFYQSKEYEVMRDFVAKSVAQVPPSGIRRFFDIAATMEDVISLGIGEPDFDTPQPILDAGIQSLQRGETHYTSNSGISDLHWQSI